MSRSDRPSHASHGQRCAPGSSAKFKSNCSAAPWRQVSLLSPRSIPPIHARASSPRAAPLEGEVVIAEAQTQGRGRLGRHWVSPPFVNLYFSMVLRPKLPPAHAPQITLMAAVALADTVAAFIAEPPAIKWPNDILVDGKKLAGILTESSCTSERIELRDPRHRRQSQFSRRSDAAEIRARATSSLELRGKP